MVVWDLVERVCLPTLVGHTAEVSGMAFTPDSTVLATCSQVGLWGAQGCSIKGWGLLTRDLLFSAS